jgi:hypothetical protein
VIENDEYHFSALTKYDHKMTMSEINKVRKPLRLPLHKGAFCFVQIDIWITVQILLESFLLLFFKKEDKA